MRPARNLALVISSTVALSGLPAAPARAETSSWWRDATAGIFSTGAYRALPTVKGTPGPEFAPGTRISSQTSQQVMVATRTSGIQGTYKRYEWTQGIGWKLVGSANAIFGYGGMKDGSRRVEGDGSTPRGVYPIKETFGVGNPGTRMLYRKINSCSWWSEKGTTYNRFVQQCGHNSGEHLSDYTTNKVKQYQQTAVIGFNWNQIRAPKPGSGSAIFLHYAEAKTAGCVGVRSRTEMNNTVKWLDPAKHPMIVIQG